MSTEVQRAANILEGKGYLVERIYDGPDFSFVSFIDRAMLEPGWPTSRQFGYVCFLAKEISEVRRTGRQAPLVEARVREAELRLLDDIGKTRIKETRTLKRLGVSLALTLLAVYPLIGRIPQ